MTPKIVAAAWLGIGLGAGLGVGAATAQGFAGAEVEAEILAFADDTSLGETRYAAGLEFDLPAGFALGANLAYHGFRGLDLDGQNATLHGQYELTGGMKVGGFYAHDSLEDGDVDAYGVEASTTVAGALALDGALGRYDAEGGDGAYLSAAASYPMGRFALTGFAGAVTGELDASRLSVGGEMRIGGRGPTLYAEVGKADMDGEGEAYLSLGARVGLGRNGGTTFGNRGLLEIVPGM